MRPAAFLFLAVSALTANAYWLMGIENFITTERIDPVVNPGKISGHVHSVLGGSNFRFSTSTAQLRQSECTSIPIPQDKSNYWFPHLYFQWKNGSFTSANGGAVIYYLFSDKPGTTTAFPDDFRMLSGDPLLRTYDPNSFAQRAVTFLCLDFKGTSKRYNSLPTVTCPDGIRAEINFPSCWDGKNTDSPDHKSHVAFLSGGPDSGSCSDPKFPVTLPRIFLEVYWGTPDFDSVRSQAMNPSQPFVFSHGDPTGYGNHADFINGWDAGVLQNAVDKCHCDPFGSAQCCADQKIFDLTKGKNCRITPSINEQTTGTLAKLPGNNPVQPAGQRATMYADENPPALISPVYAYTGNSPTQTGTVVPGSGGNGGTSSSTSTSSTTTQTTTTTTTTSTSNAPTSTTTTSTSTSTSTSTTTRTTSTSTTSTTTRTTTTQNPTFPTYTFPSISIPAFPTTQKGGYNYGSGEATPAKPAPAAGSSSAPAPPASSPAPPAASPAPPAPATGNSSSNGNGKGGNSGYSSSSPGKCSKRGHNKRRSAGFENHKHRREASSGWYQAPHVRHYDYY